MPVRWFNHSYIPWLIAFVSALTIGICLFFGSVSIPLDALWQTPQSHQDALTHDILWSIRFPRVLAAYATGGLLAFSGCLSQTIFQNSLADSYLLGTSSGASLCMLIAVLLGVESTMLPICAGVGALIAVFAILAIASPFLGIYRQSSTAISLLLTGVMISALMNAAILLLLTVLPDHAMRGTLFWIIGDLSYPEYWAIACWVLVLALCIAIPFSKTLTVLTYGPVQARALGVHIPIVYAFTVLAIALSAGMAVAVAGPIGFIGLISPHLCRYWIGGNLTRLLPASIAVGGILLLIADTVGRTVAAPIQLPAGIFTILLGAPLLLWRLRIRNAEVSA